MRTSVVRRFAALVIGTVVAIPLLPNTAQAHSSQRCERVTQQVTLSPSEPTRYTVVGWLCGPRNARTVQLLNPGLTYGSYYWDLPYQSKRYSYVRAATRAGFATLNLDRIGTGQSDKPPAEQVTIPAHAWVSAQLADSLRDGKIGRHRTHFRHVIGVGHSLGGIVVTVAQADYQPFDAIVPNGIMHAADTAFLATLGAGRYDASLDPKFANAGLPAGYITSRPGTRQSYYDVRFADPKVIELDERLKQTATTGEVATLALARDLSYSQRVTVPTLLWMGSTDALHCNEAITGLSCASVEAILSREAPAWSSSSCLGAYLQRRAGHDTTLHRSAPAGAWATNRWLTELGFGPKKSRYLPRPSDYALCA